MNILVHLRKSYLSVFLAFLVLFVSCEKYDRDIPTSNLSENYSAKFSGQELFSSVIFMEGKATSLFPIIEENFNIREYLNSPEKKEEYKKMEQRAIKFIGIVNKAYLIDYFSLALSSK